jgi:magnesium chelatase subunit I
LSNALKRSVRLGEKQVCPRVSDLTAVIASSLGKIELESLGEAREEKIMEKLVHGAVASVFTRYLRVGDLEELVAAFDGGLNIETSEDMPSMDYVHQVAELPGVKEALDKIQAQGNPAIIASGVEFILEGLHLNKKLNKDWMAGRSRYRR